MRSILNLTSFQIKKQLDNLQLNAGDIKGIFDELEKGTKDSYDEAINTIIAKTYDESYKVNLNELKAGGAQELKKEQKGIYNVAYNEKNATLIKQDLESVENAISFMQGTRYKGAKHERIKHLTDPSKQGYITDLELVNLGKSIREYLAKHQEPFIDTNGARLYEWENSEGVRFRAVVNDVADMDSNPTTATQEIITFYSDRNLKEPMAFKNPSITQATPTINKESFANFKARLESEGVASQDCANFLNFIEKNIYNDKGVSFTQLNNALKNLNSYYKEAKDPNFKSHIKQALDSFLREDIQAGIEQIFKQKPSMYKDIKTLYSSALQDYANMKEVLKSPISLKLETPPQSRIKP